MSSNIKIFQILYPYPAGGSHLSNLLSLGETFYPYFLSENYFEELKSRYLKKLQIEINSEQYNKILNFINDPNNLSDFFNAHIYKNAIQKELDIIEHNNFVEEFSFVEININHQRIMIRGCTKASEFNSFKFNKFFISTAHHYNVSSKFLPTNNIARKFIQILYNEDRKGIIMSYPKNQGRAGKRFNVVNRSIKNQYANYRLPFYSNSIELFNETNGLLVDTNLFIEDDGSKYLQDLLKSKFDIHLPDTIHELHSIWCKIIDKSIAIAENK